jgi:outer membrane protein W
MKRLLPLIFFGCILSVRLMAQSSCTQTLRTARATYDQGRLHELPALLEGCLRNGFTKQERVEAYKLLTLAYIYLEEPAKADEAMLNLLRTDHYFEINPATDPAEFIGLYKTFRTTPIYRIGFKIGANASRPNVMESVEANEGTSEYKSGTSVQFHAILDLPLSNSLTLTPELGLMQRGFKYTNTIGNADSTFATTAAEKQTWVSLPITLQYQFNRFSFKPYIGVGVQADYLLASTLNAERIRNGFQFLQNESTDLKNQRKSLNVSALISAGARFRLGGGYVITEVRFAYGLAPVSNKESAFKSDGIAFKYGYADSIFKVNSLSLTVGYAHNIFNPKKLRRRK